MYSTHYRLYSSCRPNLPSGGLPHSFSEGCSYIVGVCGSDPQKWTEQGGFPTFTSNYISYLVVTHTSLPSYPQKTMSVRRRFRDFVVSPFPRSPCLCPIPPPLCSRRGSIFLLAEVGKTCHWEKATLISLCWRLLQSSDVVLKFLEGRGWVFP